MLSSSCLPFFIGPARVLGSRSSAIALCCHSVCPELCGLKDSARLTRTELSDKLCVDFPVATLFLADACVEFATCRVLLCTVRPSLPPTAPVFCLDVHTPEATPRCGDPARFSHLFPRPLYATAIPPSCLHGWPCRPEPSLFV